MYLVTFTKGILNGNLIFLYRVFQVRNENIRFMFLICSKLLIRLQVLLQMTPHWHQRRSALQE